MTLPLGHRFGLQRDMVPAAEVIPTLVPLLAYFKQDRQPGETLGDFFHRKGKDDLLAWAEHYQASVS